jgi:hypothetical protein
MKTKIKFGNIKGMLQREEMKVVIGGDAYMTAAQSAGAGGSVLAGTTLSGAQNTNLGITGGNATTFNYGGGINGSSASGNPANTYNNAATYNFGSGTSTTPMAYAKP